MYMACTPKFSLHLWNYFVSHNPDLGPHWFFFYFIRVDQRQVDFRIVSDLTIHLAASAICSFLWCNYH